MIRIDLNKALEIHKNKIRGKREELFKPLDVNFMKALEAGNSVLAAEIGTKKQALRDATDIDISNISTLDELKSTWNSEILGDSPYGN
jgi:hypothetical protein